MNFSLHAWFFELAIHWSFGNIISLSYADLQNFWACFLYNILKSYFKILPPLLVTLGNSSLERSGWQVWVSKFQFSPDSSKFIEQILKNTVSLPWSEIQCSFSRKVSSDTNVPISIVCLQVKLHQNQKLTSVSWCSMKIAPRSAQRLTAQDTHCTWVWSIYTLWVCIPFHHTKY